MNRSPKKLLALSLLGGILAGSLITSSTAATQAHKLMREYKGVRLGMKPAEVEAALGKPESKTDTSEEYKLTGEDTMTVHYDGGTVKTILLLFIDPQNVPAWKDVVGNAEVKEQPNGAKVARVELPEEKFWVSMYQNKSGTMTTITISRS
jgi:hypothetical protein